MPAGVRNRELSSGLAALDQLARERGISLGADVPVGPLTTLRVGGAADRMVVVEGVAALVAALQLAHDAGVPAGVLGKGSDLVVADEGIRGLVIRNRASGIRMAESGAEAESGTAMAALVKRCTDAGLAGLEFGTSIPGTVGGAVWANAGAHDADMRGVVRVVRAWSSGAGEVMELTNDDCAFAYRDSRFKESGEVVLSASFALQRDEPVAIAARVDGDQARRRATQPLKYQNAGSVFRNPGGDHAGRLIESAGLKGHRIGTAAVSTLHANFIVVDRDGRAADVREVGEHVRAAVADRFGISLRYEIEFVGDWPPELVRQPSLMAGVS
ncbi:MAG: UDP-N-acetylmuramate dehydrogenase [Candidatus Limnocylindria bacterium]